MRRSFKIFVDDEQIYYGDFSEVPENFRENILEALGDWGEVLGKRGLNEMIYSLFTWYGKVEMVCEDCKQSFEQQIDCVNCGGVLISKSKYEQNEKITNLLNCIGMITHLEMEQ